MPTGFLVKSVGGALKRVMKAGKFRVGQLLEACCCAVCYGGTMDCSGLAGSYTTSLPNTVTVGSCNAPINCAGTGLTNQTSATMTSSATCAFTKTYVGLANQPCIANLVVLNVLNNSQVNLDVQTIGVCNEWVVSWRYVVSGLTFVTVKYGKNIATSTDTPVGTYNFLGVFDAGGSPCAGATGDATITVSP